MIFGDIIEGADYIERPAAYAVIFDDENRVAAVKHHKGFFLLGGGSLEGEKPIETIVREIKEELAYKINLLKKIGEAVQYFSVDKTRYRMRAVFYQTSLAKKCQSNPEHELFWLDSKNITGKFFHQCHEWAIKQSIKDAND